MNFVTEYWERILGCSVAIRSFELRNIKERARKESFTGILKSILKSLKKIFTGNSYPQYFL
jgi:hypothetical protein